MNSLSWTLGSGAKGVASVIVTAYNQDWILYETLASVAAQTYRPLECIIVDDGSTDQTPSVISRFTAEIGDDLQIRHLRQTNSGAQNARNSGALASRGEFIQFLDGDDLLEPTKIADQIALFVSSEGANWNAVYGDARWLHDRGHVKHIGEMIGIGVTSDVLATLLDFSRFNPPFAYLSRRSAVEKCGCWNSALRINDDVEYFLRMACVSFAEGRNFCYSPTMTGLYRNHSRPRISDGKMLLRIECNLVILKSIEALMRAERIDTEHRLLALARAYQCVSDWASLVDKALWKESLRHSLRVHPNHIARKSMRRLLRRLLGPWLSESILRYIRLVRYISFPENSRGDRVRSFLASSGAFLRRTAT